MTTAGLKKDTPDARAAHALLSDIRTRIATQQLPYQHGVESAALESLRQIFELARQAMKDHPGCEVFAWETTQVLNTKLRPVTSKWHRALKAGLLDSRDGADAFRADLDKVHASLVQFSEKLQLMAYGRYHADDPTPDVMDTAEVAGCFEPLEFGIDASDQVITEINADERREIDERRKRAAIETPSGKNAVGVALSGGGIRSATFCLGVIQVLASRGLMKHVDFLSTVSGGGYTGSFVTSRVGAGEGFNAIGRPHGPDTDAVRYLRQNAKYLSAIDFKHRWLMVSGTLAGLLRNWLAPLFGVAVLAAVANYVGLRSDLLLTATAAMVAMSCVLIFIFGFGANSLSWAKFGNVVVGTSLLFTAGLAALYLIERGYFLFDKIASAQWPITGTALASLLAGPAVARFVPIFGSKTFRKNVLRVALILAGAVVPIILLATFYLLRELGNAPVNVDASFLNPIHHANGQIWLIAIACLSGTFTLFALNINLTGPHKLYRDQLSKTFVQTSTNKPDVPLAGVNEQHAAPYHLLNATVNLPSSRSAVLRDRKSDFFLFSKYWTGAKSVGYKKTSEWRTNGKAMDLATVMAISGAAASPHMGLTSKPTLSALLTLLNIRLGFWIANLNEDNSQNRRPGFLCLLREMTGIGMNEKSAWLNVSDGGHIENMGVYELLRRRCKYIVCVDGEEDQESTFHGQMTLIRHAQIDFGVRIEPRLDELKPDPQSQFSRAHIQLFRIRYPKQNANDKPDLGLMLYLKLSLTGDEAELLKRYRRIHPDFPHQTTLDQYYDEEQFEAYRQLGVHIAEGSFSRALLGSNTNPKDVESWFRGLAKSLLEPDSDS